MQLLCLMTGAYRDSFLQKLELCKETRPLHSNGKPTQFCSALYLISIFAKNKSPNLFAPPYFSCSFRLENIEPKIEQSFRVLFFSSFHSFSAKISITILQFSLTILQFSLFNKFCKQIVSRAGIAQPFHQLPSNWPEFSILQRCPISQALARLSSVQLFCQTRHVAGHSVNMLHKIEQFREFFSSFLHLFLLQKYATNLGLQLNL